MNSTLESFFHRLPSPHAVDAALYSRILIRRNLEGQVFPSRANDRQIEEAEKILFEALRLGENRFCLLELEKLESLERRTAVERELVPQSYAVQGKAAMALGIRSPVWCTVNEADHLRIRAESSGADVLSAFRAASETDSALGESLDYAFTPETGYLCAEIADWGMGLSASVLMHLPALAMTGLVDRALRTAMDNGISIRGFWSDESLSSGSLYELETSRGPWMDEESLLGGLSETVERITAYEKGARQELMSHDPESVRDAVGRAYGIARFAKKVSYDEGAETLSRLRLGAAAGILKGYDGSAGAKGFFSLRNAHLLRYVRREEARDGGDVSDSNRIDHLRADALRSLVSSVSILEDS